MATNKKITELTELTEANLADDDVMAIVDVSAGTTNKVRKSTLASALAGVASLTATSPVLADQPTGAVTISLDTVPITKGGTGATTDSGARTNLGLGTIATQSAASVSIIGGSITGITDLAIADGGTGASDAATARTNLGLASGATTTVGTIATQNADNVSITGGSISGISPGVTIEGSSSGDALRITQTGTGNALVVEDSTNPDSSPFVVDASGQVGIGSTPAGSVKLTVTSSSSGVTPNTTGDDAFVESSGNTGITIGSGTASNGRIYFGDSDSATAGRVGYDHSDDSLYFGTNDANQRVTINSSGNVGIGTNSPGAKLDVEGTSIPVIINSSNSNSYKIQWEDAGTTLGYLGATSSVPLIVANSSASELMRVDSGGSLLLGTTTNLGISNKLTIKYLGGGSEYGMLMRPATDSTYAIYFQNASGSNVGGIATSSSATSYYTSSDYRLKENVTDVTDGITRVKQLEPKRFNFIADPDRTVDGFLAHEVQTVVPEAISGEKDAVDSEGNPVHQGIDQSKLVPLLTAALQEAISKIEALEARVAALETA